MLFGEWRGPLTDSFFRHWTRASEVPTYGLLTLLFLFIRLRQSLLIALLGGSAALLSLGAKAFFARARPVLYLQEHGLLDTLQLVEHYGIDQLYTGATSFPSGHTLSAFALFGYLALLSAHKRWVALALFLTALLVGLSRIYLIQHFLEDVYAGSIFGMGLALWCYIVQARIPLAEHWLDRAILPGSRLPSPTAPDPENPSTPDNQATDERWHRTDG